jgi:hypothetical protein
MARKVEQFRIRPHNSAHAAACAEVKPSVLQQLRQFALLAKLHGNGGGGGGGVAEQNQLIGFHQANPLGSVRFIGLFSQ